MIEVSLFVNALSEEY